MSAVTCTKGVSIKCMSLFKAEQCVTMRTFMRQSSLSCPIEILNFGMCSSKSSHNEYGTSMIWSRSVRILTDSRFMRLNLQTGADFSAWSSEALARKITNSTFMGRASTMFENVVPTSINCNLSMFGMPSVSLFGTEVSDSAGLTSIEMKVVLTIESGQTVYSWTCFF